MKKTIRLKISLGLILFGAWALASPAQDLTVRDIMAEPALAGMRPDGEKLSPDGSKVVFLWNAEGKMPRDLYLVPTSGGTPVKILSPSEMPVPARTPERENKLDYGLVLRDEFVKARENQLGNFEWSPDSRKLIFSHGGDIYLMAVAPSAGPEQKNARWGDLDATIRRRSELLRDLIRIYDESVSQTELIASLKTQQKNLEVSLQSGGSWDSQRQITLQIDRRIGATLDRILSGPPEQWTSNEAARKLLEELQSVQNRINAARSAYESLLVDQKPKRLTKTQSPEVGARFLDNDRILFQQNGNLFVLNTADATLVQLSREANQQNFIGVFGGAANDAGTMIAYVVSDSSKQRALTVPNYLGEFTAAPTVRRGWSEQKVMVIPTDGSRDSAAEVKLPKPEGVSSFRSIKWAADGRSLIVDRVDKDTKRRQLFYVYNAGNKDEQAILVTEETDDKWQAPLSSIFEPNPDDASELFFASERDGYNHLYLVKLEKAQAQSTAGGEQKQENQTAPPYSSAPKVTQLTRGNWQVEWAEWTPDAKGIAFLSTQDGPANRELYLLDPRTGQTSKLGNSGPGGMRTSPQINEKGTNPVIIYEFSQWNRPGELYALRAGSQAPVQLTDTIPDRFEKMKWAEPQFIDIPSRDGKKIPSKIYLPAGFNARSKQKYPMVIFVHGAGYLQNTINGWNNYYREFMFNDLLTRRGYVVLDIDYRGSAGYGRDWRTDVYDFLGGKDFDDHIDSIDHMVKNYAVDPARVGVYGGSYGGFMAGMLAMRAPDKIAAAAALRPVFDWKNYYASSPGYTAQRLGFPDKNPEAYKRSSPITYADQLRRPLLILHGMADDNVHVQDSVQLIEKLIRLGKTPYFEAMLYPSENHGFVRPESWADEYERILAFFEKHLK